MFDTDNIVSHHLALTIKSKGNSAQERGFIKAKRCSAVDRIDYLKHVYY